MKIKFLAFFLLLCSCSDPKIQVDEPKKPEIPDIETPKEDNPTEETQGRAFTIHSATELSDSLPNLKPGDVVTFASGTYRDQTLVFTGEGTENAPIILRGEKAGDVIFTGNSNLKIGGKFLRVENLYFKDIPPVKGNPVIEFKVTNTLLATDCQLYNCAISGSGLDLSLVESVWVSMPGQRNVVERCSFDDKKNMGQILVVLFETGGAAPSHKILNNYFSRETSNTDAKGSSLNGQETIRIGTGAFSAQDGNCLVENNMFYRCNGEAEMVSNKTWGNTYRNNLFYECTGALTLRQGGSCVVENNYFIGNGVSNTAGIRVTGSNHIIKNNYIEETRDKNLAGICLIKGVLADPGAYPIYQYEPVVNVMLENNVLKNCSQGINIAYGSSNNLGAQATFKNNIVYNDNAANTAITYNPDVAGYTPSKITWIDNTIYHGIYVNNTTVVLPTPTEVKPPLPNVTLQQESIKANSGINWKIK